MAASDGLTRQWQHRKDSVFQRPFAPQDEEKQKRMAEREAEKEKRLAEKEAEKERRRAEAAEMREAEKQKKLEELEHKCVVGMVTGMARIPKFLFRFSQVIMSADA